jgi:DNA invertase Pin-like site-specific DNA recombinase
VLEPEFYTSTDTGRILVTVLGMVAEMERRFILERQRASIEAAKKKGACKVATICAGRNSRKIVGRAKGRRRLPQFLGVSRACGAP